MPDTQRKPKNANLRLSKKQRNNLIAYNVIMAIFLSAALVSIIAFAPSLSAKSELTNSNDNATYRMIIITTLLSMFIAGASGGMLCNLCGSNLLEIIQGHREEKEEDEGKDNYQSPIGLYLRPLTGAVTGLLAFFLGNLFVTTLSVNVSEQSWMTLTGRIPYIALAILAGYASPEFMFRIKEVAKATFSKDEKDTKGPEQPNKNNQDPKCFSS